MALWMERARAFIPFWSVLKSLFLPRSLRLLMFWSEAKESQDATTSGTFFSLGTGTSVAAAAGAGVDMKIFPFVSVRLFQLDYLRTRLHGATQNQPRVSAGIVIHF